MQRGLPGIVDALKRIDADLVALQEVAASGSSVSAAAIAARLGYQTVNSSAYVTFGQNSWRLAILVRGQIVGRNEIPLGRSRRALRVTARIRGRQVTFITLHLTPYVAGGLDLNRRYSALRKRELRDLLRFAGAPRADNPTVILGDFNMLRGAPALAGLDEYELMAESGYEDADGGWLPCNDDTFPLESVRQQAPLPWRWALPSAITLDYIFVSTGLEVIDVGSVPSEASDHFPLVLQFRLPPP
ncbi:MAG: endonuclease/exonuclease/phosphatase family protein [Leptospirales bacterium]|nr:endonuclease/exonuclease/phosphatase family protein [Leptospirales bacterium]